MDKWGKVHKCGGGGVAPVNVAEKEEVDITGIRTQPVVMSLQCVCDRVVFFVRACIVGRTTWGFLTFCLQLQMAPDTGALWPLDYDHWEMDGRGGQNPATVVQTAACRSPAPQTGLSSENDADFIERSFISF